VTYCLLHKVLLVAFVSLPDVGLRQRGERIAADDCAPEGQVISAA
jgi:hypothetical protein